MIPSPLFVQFQKSLNEREEIEKEGQFFTELSQYGLDSIQLLQERKLLIRQEGSARLDNMLFVEATEHSLLARLQNDMIKLGMQGENNGRKWTIPKEDHSLQIHACHSRMREVEVLHNQLLRLLDQNPDLTPDDILVMTPQIDEYVPFIDAVFSASVKGEQFDEALFPYAIADQSFGHSSQVITYLLRLLCLSDCRFTVNEVLDILESEAIQARFQLVPSDIALLRHWMKKVNVRWGIDSSFRNQLETPATQENTWQFGIDRILLGFAMPGDGETLFAGILPFDDIEGESALMFGRFLDFFSNLQTLMDGDEGALSQKRNFAPMGRFSPESTYKIFCGQRRLGNGNALLKEVFRKFKGDCRKLWSNFTIRSGNSDKTSASRNGAGIEK